MSNAGWSEPSSSNRTVVTTALRRVVSVEGVRVFADPGRLGALLRDELGAEGHRQRAVVDALTSLAGDVGPALAAAPPFQIGPILQGWVSNQRQVDPSLARLAAEATGGALNATPGPFPPPPEPVSQPQGGGFRKRAWAIPVAAFLAGALVLGGVWFVVEVSTAETDAPTQRASTTTVTSVRTVTETATPSIVAVPVDIQAASIAGTWDVTLTQVGCVGLSSCPPNGSTLTGRMVLSCSSTACSGTFLGDALTVGFDAARGGWVLNGQLAGSNSYTCNEVPIPSFQDWLLGVAQARYVNGGWVATSLTGQRTESAPAAGGCLFLSIGYSVAATPV